MLYFVFVNTLLGDQPFIVTRPSQNLDGPFELGDAIPIRYTSKQTCSVAFVDYALCRYTDGGGYHCFDHTSNFSNSLRAVHLNNGKFELTLTKAPPGGSGWYRIEVIDWAPTRKKSVWNTLYF